MRGAPAPVAPCPVCTEHAETVLRVAGMDCHDEVAILERRLGRLPGFEALSADLVGQRLRVTHDRSRLPAAAIVRAIAETGMRAWPDGDLAPAGAGASSLALLAPVIVSGACLAFGTVASALGAPAAVTKALLGGAVLSGAAVTLRRALAAVRTFAFDINVLMLVAVAGGVAIGEWSEAATVIFLFALAQWLEARSMDRVRHAIRALVDLAPVEAVVRRNGQDARVPVDEIDVGETLIIRPGEKIPLDGRVIAGETAVNQAPITGESLPVEKRPGSDVFAGSINGGGAVEVRVTHLRRDTTLARIISLVETAQAQRAPAQAFVDRFSRAYTPAVIALAAAVAVGPPLFLGRPLEPWLYRALVLLVISCPCALVISTPVSIVSALAGAARRGVLIKGGLHLEQAARVRAVAFDKTGTLTNGRPEVVSVATIDGAGETDLLRVAAALESRSEHPIAEAIVRRAESAGIDIVPAADLQALSGLGATGQVDGRPALIGNHRMFEERGLVTAGVEARLQAVGRRGETGVLVAHAGRVVGLIGVADRPRDSARGVLADLHRLGVRNVVMLTGDNETTSRVIADEIGVDEVWADLLPEDKVEAVEEVRRRHGVVMMVGDGVNDAPALAASDLGVAMGAAGSDAAIETADVALMAGDLRKVAYLVRLGRATRANILANIVFSLALKAVFLVMGVAGYATLWMAVVADMGASLAVIANGLRLLRRA